MIDAVPAWWFLYLVFCCLLLADWNLKVPKEAGFLKRSIGDDATLSDFARREVVWTNVDQESSNIRFRVVSLPMKNVLLSLAKGHPAKVAIKKAPELDRLLEGVVTPALESVVDKVDLAAV